jgi:hypothetical protein
MKINNTTLVLNKYIKFTTDGIIDEKTYTKIGTDLYDFLYSNNEFYEIIENHIELNISTKYRRLSADSIYYILYGYIFNCEIDMLEEELNRDLTNDEKEWFENEFRYLVRENVHH